MQLEKKNRLHINLLNREIIQDYFQQDFLYALVTDTTEYLHYKFSENYSVNLHKIVLSLTMTL